MSVTLFQFIIEIPISPSLCHEYFIEKKMFIKFVLSHSKTLNLMFDNKILMLLI